MSYFEVCYSCMKEQSLQGNQNPKWFSTCRKLQCRLLLHLKKKCVADKSIVLSCMLYPILPFWSLKLRHINIKSYNKTENCLKVFMDNYFN